MATKADDLLTKLQTPWQEMGTGSRVEEQLASFRAEAKQQLAEELIASLPEKHKKYPDYKWTEWDDGFNAAIDQAEAAIREYFK